MTEPGDTAARASTAQEIKAGLVRLLTERIREISDDPRQMRDVVYELARIKLLEQFTHVDAREARALQQVLERAIREVEGSFEPSGTSSPPKAAAAAAANSPPANVPVPPTILTAAGSASPAIPTAETPRHPAAPPGSLDQAKRSGAFKSLVRLTAILLLVAGAGTAVVSWPRLKTPLTALSQVAPLSERAQKSPEPQPTGIPTRSAGETVERTPDSSKEPAPAAHPSMPLPATFGVYALSEGQLHELKPVPGKIPDRRVAISAAINTPSVTTLSDGDVKFIVFRPDGGVDASGTEVRVVAKVSRAMGVDATGKAAMVSAGDSWGHPQHVLPLQGRSDRRPVENAIAATGARRLYTRARPLHRRGQGHGLRLHRGWNDHRSQSMRRTHQCDQRRVLLALPAAAAIEGIALS